MSSRAALAYTNRLGDTYYLHQGRTTTGKPRYFASRALGEGALATMPDGFEFTESINAVVSVARKGRKGRDPVVVPTDVALVEAEVARHEHLWACRVAVFRGAIVVYQCLQGESIVDSAFGRSWWEGLEDAAARRRLLAEARALVQARGQFDPVFRFTPVQDRPGIYLASRMSYRGRGGWLDLRSGPLLRLVREYIKLLGTDELFEHF